MGDLDKEIAYHRKLLRNRFYRHSQQSTLMNNLAILIGKRYEETGKVGDLEEAIAYHRQSLDLCPPGNPGRPLSLSNLAVAVWTRFEKTGNMADLEDAITYNLQSLDLSPPSGPQRSMALSNLAVAIWTRFQQTGKMADLEEAIAYYRQSLDLRPLGDPERSMSLCNLAVAMWTRYQQIGKPEDLEEAVAYHRQSLDLRPLGDPQRSMSLSNLAVAIWTRFRQTGKMADLEEAITYYRQSLDLRPPGHHQRSMSLTNLAVAIWTLFQQTGEMKDLEEAIGYHRQSLELRPPGHPQRAMSLSNLARAIWTRYEKTEQPEGLEEAVAYHRQSLDLRPPGHPDRFMSLNYLAAAIRTRFNKTGNKEDLGDATKLLSDAENNLPANHPLRAHTWAEFAYIHLAQHSITPTTQQLSKAFASFEKSANHHTASIRVRFKYALQWATAAQLHRDESVIRAYSISFTLLERYLVTTPNVEAQQKFLASTIPKTLASDAASSAIEAGRPDAAVELLDRGRAIILSKIRKHRHPIKKLRTVDPELADEFKALSVELERNALSSESEWVGNRSSVVIEAQQQKHRVLSDRWDKVVEKIRKIEGFADFLQAVPFTTLRKAAAEGPVIIININSHRSDAIIVRDAEPPPVVVPLPDALPDDITQLSSQFSDPRASKKQGFSRNLCPILQSLWHMIVGPVTEQLSALGVEEMTRIWWCPTSDLCALPLHAAGPYLRGQKGLSDLYISSYTSTLSALIAARSSMAVRNTVPNLLVIADTGQPNALIPEVEEELHRIQKLGDFVDVLVKEAANRDNVISGLQQHSWAHFSCHGHRHLEPFHSSFQLYDGKRLEVLELIHAQLPNAEHAFLSACHAAAADIQGTPDEVIHLAGALQLCGFRSVVGTMWAMADIDGPDVAEDFYRYMFRNPGHVDFRDSAKALNNATREMRRRKGMTLGRWVNFIHIGA